VLKKKSHRRIVAKKFEICAPAARPVFNKKLLRIQSFTQKDWSAGFSPLHRALDPRLDIRLIAPFGQDVEAA
jgi:hypothetical protein